MQFVGQLYSTSMASVTVVYFEATQSEEGGHADVTRQVHIAFASTFLCGLHRCWSLGCSQSAKFKLKYKTKQRTPKCQSDTASNRLMILLLQFVFEGGGSLQYHVMLSYLLWHTILH